jgi:hypothetical protein
MVSIVSYAGNSDGVLSRPADLILARGQRNFEPLSDHPAYVALLLQAKCHVIADSARRALATHGLVREQIIIICYIYQIVSKI